MVPGSLRNHRKQPFQNKENRGGRPALLNEHLSRIQMLLGPGGDQPLDVCIVENTQEKKGFTHKKSTREFVDYGTKRLPVLCQNIAAARITADDNELDRENPETQVCKAGLR